MNRNQGAESTLAALGALVELELASARPARRALPLSAAEVTR